MGAHGRDGGSLGGRERFLIFWNILTFFLLISLVGRERFLIFLEYFDIFIYSSVLWEGNGGRAIAVPLAPSWAEGVASYRW